MASILDKMFSWTLRVSTRCRRVTLKFFVIDNKFVLIVDNNDNVVSDSSLLFACLLCSCSCEVEYLLFVYQWQGLVWATRIIDIEMQLCNKSVQFPCDDKRKIQDYGLRSFGNH